MRVWWKLGILCSAGVSAGMHKICEPKALHLLLLMWACGGLFTQDGECVFVCIQTVWETYVDNMCGSQGCGEYAGVCWKRCVHVYVCGCTYMSRLRTPRKIVPEPWTTLPNLYILDLPPTHFQRLIWRCSPEYWPPALLCPFGTLVPNYSLDQAQSFWGTRHFLVHIGFSQTLV